MTEVSLILSTNDILCHYDREARVHALASIWHRSPALINAAIGESGFEDSGDAGALDADAYLRGFAAANGYNLSEAEWVAALGAAITPIPEALALISRIPTDIICAELTNNHPPAGLHFATLYPEVAVRVGDHAYVSAEFAVRKPDPEALSPLPGPPRCGNRPPRCSSMTAKPTLPLPGWPDCTAATPPAPKTFRRSFRAAGCSTDTTPDMHRMIQKMGTAPPSSHHHGDCPADHN